MSEFIRVSEVTLKITSNKIDPMKVCRSYILTSRPVRDQLRRHLLGYLTHEIEKGKMY